MSTSEAKPGRRPLDGIKVLAATSALAAPFAAYHMALHGAEVISIEDPGTGNTTRRGGSREGKRLSDLGMSAGFMAHAANKKSLTLNLREAAAREIYFKLAREADVIVENFRAGTLDGLGVGYEAMRKINPRIVYCALSGFGQSGPKKRDPAIDPIIQAASGLMSVVGTPQTGPLKTGPQIVDYGTGLSVALGIMMALFHRERTGEGQFVDVSMLDTAVTMMSNTVCEVINAGFVPGLTGNRLINDNHVCDSFRCSDGGHVFIGATRENLRQRLWKALERPDIPADPRFADVEAIRGHAEELYAELRKSMATRPAVEWEEVLAKAGVPAMRVHTIAEMAQHPQILHRKLFHKLEAAQSGVGQDLQLPLTSYQLSATPARIDSPPPFLGQHTEQVLRGLGYSAEDIVRLREAGAV